MTPIEKFEAALGKLGKEIGTDGAENSCCCPVHERGPGHNPSLIFRETEDGTLFVKCLSRGCSYADIMAAVGLKQSDGFPHGKQTPEKKKIAKTAREKDAAEKAAKRAVAAEKAKAILEASGPAKPHHPYCTRKKIKLPKSVHEIDAGDVKRILSYAPKSNGEPLQGRLLAVPVFVDGALSTIEFIDETGRKSAIAGGRKTDAYWLTRPLPKRAGMSTTILVGEGVATVVSATMATGHLGVAALSCTNLLSVGKMLRARYPQAKLVFLADMGIGEEKCAEAARAVDGFVYTPTFGASQ
jgi:putative DNA primase/helicase